METSSKGGADHKLQTMCTLIMSIGTERFGVTERYGTSKPVRPNRQEHTINQLRQELKTLKRQFRAAKEEERIALNELREISRRKLITLRRAEWHRRKGKERAKKRKALISNPFSFTKRLLGQKKSGDLTCSAEEINHHLSITFRDPLREQDIGLCEALVKPPAPMVQFNTSEPTLKEVKKAVMAAKSGSAPCRVYKQCPRLLVRLWKIINVIWQRGRVATQWRSAEGVWIPKEEGARNIEQFRIISLLSEFLLRNGYIDTSVCKGGVPGVSESLKHTGVVTQLILEARESRGDLAAFWLNLTNTYGFIPHKLVETALARLQVPESIQNPILDYYNNF